MAASKVPPEGKSEAPSKRRSWLDPATWAGIFSIVFDLPRAVMIGPTQTVASATRTAAQLKLSEAALAAGSVFVPAGEFLMGSAEGTAGADADEKPQHQVYLDAYWIDRVEVTNAMYARCVAAGACSSPSDTGSGSRSIYYGNPEYDDYPVVYVSWTDGFRCARSE